MSKEDFEAIVADSGVKVKALYRHFKGHYAIPLDFCFDADSGKVRVFYRCFLKSGERLLYVRDIDTWFTDVSKREDNVTNNTYRFELVKEEVVI